MPKNSLIQFQRRSRVGGFTPALRDVVAQFDPFYIQKRIKSLQISSREEGIVFPRKSNTPSSVWGFTMLELLVALGVFSVVVLFASSSLLMLTSTQRRSAAIQNTQDNVRFAMDAIAKNIRTGADYECVSIPPPGIEYCEHFRFTDESSGDNIEYRLNNSRIEICETAACADNARKNM